MLTREKVREKKQRVELKEVLKRLHSAKPEEFPKIKREAQSFFKGVDPTELARAPQDLISEGVEHTEMKRLCDVHLEVMKRELGIQRRKREKLSPSHPIQICMDEHKIIKRNLRKLKRGFENLKKFESSAKANKGINKLKELSHFFLETEKHHKREEDGLFPKLEAHGITEPPKIFKADHVEFLAKKRELFNNLMTEKNNLRELISGIGPIVHFLTDNLNDHIYKEDNILYQIALKTLSVEEWKEVRKKFDAIGYCCFAPKDLKKEG